MTIEIKKYKLAVNNLTLTMVQIRVNVCESVMSQLYSTFFWKKTKSNCYIFKQS